MQAIQCDFENTLNLVAVPTTTASTTTSTSTTSTTTTSSQTSETVSTTSEIQSQFNMTTSQVNDNSTTKNILYFTTMTSFEQIVIQTTTGTTSVNPETGKSSILDSIITISTQLNPNLQSIRVIMYVQPVRNGCT